MGEQREEGSGPAPPPPATAAPISQSQFLAWKNRKDDVAAARKAEESRKREDDIAAGLVQMNGRELVQHEPWEFDNIVP